MKAGLIVTREAAPPREELLAGIQRANRVVA
jgi:hypothetical protein